MKASISLDKERIKLKGNGQKVIVPIYPSQAETQTKPIDKEVDVRQLYQIQNDEDYTEPSSYGELHLENQDSVGYNLDAELYDWEIKIMKQKQGVVGLFRLSRRNQLNNDFLYRIFQKYLKRK